MRSTLLLFVTCLMTFQGQSVVAQRNQERGGQGEMQGQRGGQGQRGRQGQVPPLFRIFDTDGNNELSAEEISDAAQALKKLDKNEDGKLTPDEFRPSGGRPGQQGRSMQGPPNGRQGQGGRSNDGRGGQQAGRSGGGRGAQQGGRGGQSGEQGGGGRRGDPAQADAQFATQLMELDANQDNQIGSDEIPPHMQTAFKLADADKNNSLDQTELLVLASQFRRNELNPAGENAEMKNRPTGGAPRNR